MDDREKEIEIELEAARKRRAALARKTERIAHNVGAGAQVVGPVASGIARSSKEPRVKAVAAATAVGANVVGAVEGVIERQAKKIADSGGRVFSKKHEIANSVPPDATGITPPQGEEEKHERYSQERHNSQSTQGEPPQEGGGHPQDEASKKMVKIIVDSQPMQEVHIKIEKRFAKHASSSIAPEEIARILKIENVDSWLAANRIEHAMAAISQFETQIFAAINEDKDKREIPSRDRALETARKLLRQNSIANEDLADLMTSKIYDPAAQTRRELYWLDLDEWRVQELGKDNTTPFALRRYTVYLASLNTLNEMRRRDEQRSFGVHNWVNLDDKNLVRKISGTFSPDRSGIVDRNTFTYFELTSENGMYRFTADPVVKINTPDGIKDARFDRWEITSLDPINNSYVYDIATAKGERYVRSVQEGLVTHWENVVSINVEGRIKIVAYYAVDKGTMSFNRNRPGIRSPYKTGTYPGTLSGEVRRFNSSGPGGIASAAKNTAAGYLNLSGVKGRIGREVAPRNDLKRNPALLAAANKGKRILNRYAKAEYTRLFIRGPKTLGEEYKRRAKELRELEKAARTARNNLRKLIREEGRHGVFERNVRRTNQDLVNMADDVRRERAAGGLGENVAINEARDTLQTYLNSREKFFEDYKRDFEAASAHLQSYLIGKSQTVSIELARRYRIGLNSSDEAELEKELQAYAVTLAEDFSSRGRTFGHSLIRGLGIVSRGTQTFGAAGMNVLENLWDFAFGPWTWTTILVVAQFFFILTYVGYNIYYLWIFPIIGAAFTFLMNFSDSFRPLDWWTHLMSGANIGYSALLLLIALDALDWTGGSVYFWIVWAVVGFIGVMQFYQIGGWRVILQGAVIVLFFAWVALGPYASYYQQTLDQIKTPVEIVYNGISEAFTNIWLLATNPTEFYARQQVINVRPERPIDLEKGVEVTLFEALPQSVPSQQEFGLTAVLTNEGSINESAKDIKLTLTCNQWCDSRAAAPEQVASLKARNEVSGQTTIYYLKDEMDRGDAISLNVRGFKALGDNVRVGETRIAKVTFNLSYRYSSSSSLLTDVMSQDEVNRRLQNREDLFHNVLAVAKLSPAQLSLNVGPQPLISTPGTTSLLLVSVFSTRDDGVVKLPKDSKIVITLPRSVGENLDCDNEQAQKFQDREVVEYKVPSDVEILPRKFNSIFAFICNFNPVPVSDVKSDIITAELPSYVFVLTREKDVPVTPPVGIIFNPYEKQCNVCGQTSDSTIINAFDKCSVEECHSLSTSNNKCWAQFSGSIATGGMEGIFGDRCKTCVNVKCEDFLSQPDCEGEAVSQCNIGCYWDLNVINPTLTQIGERDQPDGQGYPTTGACLKRVVSGSPITTATGAAAGLCSGVPANYRTSYNTYKDLIATAITNYQLRTYVLNSEALVAAVITKESHWNPTASGDNGNSIGLMQIYIDKHPECGISKTEARDPEKNINCGVKILADIAKTKDISTPKAYNCKSVTYTGIDAILRWYNGWASDCSGTPNYVDDIKSQDSGKGGYMNDWNGCFQQIPQQPVQETCQSCMSSGKIWCENSPPLLPGGNCILSPQICDQTQTPVTDIALC